MWIFQFVVISTFSKRRNFFQLFLSRITRLWIAVKLFIANICKLCYALMDRQRRQHEEEEKNRKKSNENHVYQYVHKFMWNVHKSCFMMRFNVCTLYEAAKRLFRKYPTVLLISRYKSTMYDLALSANNFGIIDRLAKCVWALLTHTMRNKQWRLSTLENVSLLFLFPLIAPKMSWIFSTSDHLSLIS